MPDEEEINRLVAEFAATMIEQANHEEDFLTALHHYAYTSREQLTALAAIAKTGMPPELVWKIALSYAAGNLEIHEEEEQ